MGDILDNFQKAKIGKPYGSDFLAIAELKAMPINYPLTNTEDRAIKALEDQKPYDDFARWVATEIFDDNWEYNKESFAELACRKLAKLGIVVRMGDEWELIESLERSDKK